MISTMTSRMRLLPPSEPPDATAERLRLARLIARILVTDIIKKHEEEEEEEKTKQESLINHK